MDLITVIVDKVIVIGRRRVGLVELVIEEINRLTGSGENGGNKYSGDHFKGS